MSLTKSPFKPGDCVRYTGTPASKNHDHWVGTIVEIIDIQSLYGDRREVYVRWIKPCGDPTDGLTRCSEEELTAMPTR